MSPTAGGETQPRMLQLVVLRSLRQRPLCATVQVCGIPLRPAPSSNDDVYYYATYNSFQIIWLRSFGILVICSLSTWTRLRNPARSPDCSGLDTIVGPKVMDDETSKVVKIYHICYSSGFMHRDPDVHGLLIFWTSQLECY